MLNPVQLWVDLPPSHEPLCHTDAQHLQGNSPFCSYRYLSSVARVRLSLSTTRGHGSPMGLISLECTELLPAFYLSVCPVSLSPAATCSALQLPVETFQLLHASSSGSAMSCCCPHSDLFAPSYSSRVVHLFLVINTGLRHA